MKLELIHCINRTCGRNPTGYGRFKGYKKCSGCRGARIFVNGHWRYYDLKEHRDLLTEDIE